MNRVSSCDSTRSAMPLYRIRSMSGCRSPSTRDAGASAPPPPGPRFRGAAPSTPSTARGRQVRRLDLVQVVRVPQHARAWPMRPSSGHDVHHEVLLRASRARPRSPRRSRPPTRSPAATLSGSAFTSRSPPRTTPWRETPASRTDLPQSRPRMRLMLENSPLSVCTVAPAGCARARAAFSSASAASACPGCPGWPASTARGPAGSPPPPAAGTPRSSRKSIRRPAADGRHLAPCPGTRCRR